LKISIITVCFNSQETILDTILSVQSQSARSNIEYIIIDGGSTDNTLQIIKDNISYVDIFISEPDKGIYDAMNKGIDMANGEIVGILNSDDLYFDKDVIKLIFAEFVKNPMLDIVYGNLVYVDKFNVDKIIRKWISLSNYDRYFENGNVPPHPTLFVKKIIYKHSGKFKLEYKLAADYELMIRFFKLNTYNIVYIPIYMIRMRLGGATNRSFRNIYNGNIEIFKAWSDNNLKIPIYFFPLKFFKRLLQFI
jgi:glycosyltransferase involved in cell wall biosynthesis